MRLTVLDQQQPPSGSLTKMQVLADLLCWTVFTVAVYVTCASDVLTTHILTDSLITTTVDQWTIGIYSLTATLPLTAVGAHLQVSQHKSRSYAVLAVAGIINGVATGIGVWFRLSGSFPPTPAECTASVGEMTLCTLLCLLVYVVALVVTHHQHTHQEYAA